MTIDQFRKWLAKEVAKAGGQHKFAEKYGVDQSVTSLVLCGKREPSIEYAKSLGWAKEPEFRRIK